MKFKELTESNETKKFASKIENVINNAIEEIDKCSLEISESKLFKSKIIRAISDLEKVIKDN